MKAFEPHFREAMRSKAALLDRIMHYIVKRKGKQMRPMFTLLSARLFGEVHGERVRGGQPHRIPAHRHLGARRCGGRQPLMRRVLQHQRALEEQDRRAGGRLPAESRAPLGCGQGEFEVLRIVSHAVREMSEGELLQLEKSRNLNFSEEVYFTIIRQKTASLIAACCASGTSAAGRPADEVERMRRFGELVGIAFQIKDDLFDYGNGEDIGKPSGLDIKEKN
jgi:octaprenyl-diphosphate synthase